MDFESFKSIALSFPETSVEIHPLKISFRVGKKIFATYEPEIDEAIIKLGIYKQDEFCQQNPGLLKRVRNKWGKKGWTLFKFREADESLGFEILKHAFLERAPKILVKKYQRSQKSPT
jgi:hypothetical protein